MKQTIGTIAVLLVLLSSCTQEKTLPYMGFHDVNAKGDTLYHEVFPFAFSNQNGTMITNETVKGKPYLAYYFFTHCPTMCPKMIVQMKRVRKAHPDMLILAHTCDPERDSQETLSAYAEKHKIDTSNWHFLTGSKSELYVHGADSYLLASKEDVMAPGGFLHSSSFILVDSDGHVRGAYDGQNTQEVDRLIEDIKLVN